jgi:nicotinic acid mononucleotide adenylyltransferase
MPPTPISSSGIRAMIAAGGDWRKMVPRAVGEYIETQELYRASTTAR